MTVRCTRHCACPAVCPSLLAGVGFTLCHSAVLSGCLLWLLNLSFHPRSLHMHSEASCSQATHASPRVPQMAQSGLCWGCWGEALQGRRANASSVLQTRGLFCPFPLLSWGVALECVFPDYENDCWCSSQKQFCTYVVLPSVVLCWGFRHGWFWWEAFISCIYLPFKQVKAAVYKTAGAQILTAN